MKKLLLVLALVGLVAAPVMACPPPAAPAYDGPGIGSGPGDPSSGGSGDGGTTGTDSTTLPPSSSDIATDTKCF